MIDFDEGLVKEFVLESKEHIDVIEKSLLELENNFESPNSELINQLFRAVHSMKGAAGFFGFKNLTNLSHKMETLMQKIRDNELKFTEVMFEPLFTGIDYLKQMLNDLDNSETIDLSAVSDKFTKLSEGKPISNINKQNKKFVSFFDNLSDNFLKELKNNGKNNIFIIKLNLPVLLDSFSKFNLYISNLSALGKILKFSDNYKDIIDKKQLEYLEIVYDTIMEKDLVSVALNLKEEHIFDVKELSDVNKKVKPQVSTKNEKAIIEPIEVKSVKQEEVKDEIIENTFKEEIKKEIDTKDTNTDNKKNKVIQDETIRVTLSHLNKLMNLAGELVLSRNQLLQTLNGKDIPVLNVLSQRITEMQENIMSTRMQPIENLFNKFTRVVRDLSKSVDKKIQLDIISKNVEVDNTIIEAMSDPLTHLIRNAVDHGIETPKERIKAGKSQTGVVTLTAAHKGGHVIITIKDDGKGIDVNKIKEKAISKGLLKLEEFNNMSDKDIVNIIFRPGFSTAEKITAISGRGVGMDVVKTNLEKIGGTIEVETKLGTGSEFIITIPLTLAIIPTLIVEASLQKFAIPQINIVELVRLKSEDITERIEILGKSQVLRLREQLLPLVNLRNVLNLEPLFKNPETGEVQEDKRVGLVDRRLKQKDKQGNIVNDNKTKSDVRKETRRKGLNNTINIVVVSMGTNDFGIIIDKVLDTEEIVVKPLSHSLKKISLFSGATIMGDGKVILILDVANISKQANLSFRDVKQLSMIEQEKKTAESMLEKQDFFLFNLNSYEQFSIPLSLIERIEQFNSKNIQIIGNNEYINYLGKSLRIVRLENILNISKPATQNEILHLIIPQLSAVKIGFVFSNIIDVRALNVMIDKDTIRSKGILGTALVDEKITIFIDIYTIIEMVDPDNFKNINKNAKQNKKKKVLLAEDTPFFRSLVSGYITSAGYECIAKNDGLEAYEYLLANYKIIDIVVSDIQMPKMNGFELVKKIKTTEELAHFIVIALTSLDNPENIQQGKEAGFDDYQIKVDKEKLLESINKHLEMQK